MAPPPSGAHSSRKHDTIYVYTKSKEYTFNADDVRVPYNESTVKTFSSARPALANAPDLERGKVPEDWWYFQSWHECTWSELATPHRSPEALLERIVLASSNPGDLVADFFSGSGTTAANRASIEPRVAGVRPSHRLR